MPNGTALIKPEFLLLDRSGKPAAADPPPDDDAAEGSTLVAAGNGEANGEPPAKKQKLSGAQKKKLAREQGASKREAKNSLTMRQRKVGWVGDDFEMCWTFAIGRECPHGDKCKYSHDIQRYLSKEKAADLPWTPNPVVSETYPFVDWVNYQSQPVDTHSSVDLGTLCPNFLRYGFCRLGFKCRFLGGHIRVQSGSEASDNEEERRTQLELIGGQSSEQQVHVASDETNLMDGLRLKLLRQKKIATPIADAYVRKVEYENAQLQKPKAERVEAQNSPPFEGSVDDVHPEADTPDVPMRLPEKKRLHWEGMTYLAPLTTVGNLPFRRLCTDLGVDITCSEMALTPALLSGSKDEWTLLRRHSSEKFFGIQLAGNKPAPLTKAAEIIAKQSEAGNFEGVSFVDLNCGCPIDMVFQTGAGSALLDYHGKLGKIVKGMNMSLGDIPVTIKIRTGVKDGRNTAHKMMPNLKSWGVSAMTIHGRSRQQRYTKLADWEYIKTCVEASRAQTADDDLPPVPIFGGGDVYSSADYWDKTEKYGVDGIMIARGALMKPWIFTEVKERREWDISARERLELVRKFAEYGLNHWGSDSVGVNVTRRFLCEALSFQHRYVPLGILETPVAYINDRAPAYKGRNELETLLSSSNSDDWVKISEMFLGPAPESWKFVPKHKSNAVEANG